MRTAFVLALVLGVASGAQCADSTQYPTRPVRLVVPQPPGGGTTFVARLIAPRLSESLKQQVVVDNRSGAGGIVGTEIVARAAPDGYTLLLGYTGPLTINPGLHASLPYRPIEDFDPISLAVSSPFVLLAHPSVRAATPAELVSLSKSRSDPFNFGTPGNGSLHHLAMEWLKSATGARLTHIPYKGTPMTALVAGEVSLAFINVLTSQAQIKAGRVKALAITSRTRSRLMPELPTIAELLVPGFEAANWFGVLAPRGTPRPIITRLSNLIATHIHSPEIKERLLADGAEAVGSTPEAFAKVIAAELKRWREVIEASGAKLG